MSKLHHANIILSNESHMQKVQDILLREISFETKGNPDFLLLEEESFSIEGARMLERWAIGKPLLGGSKVCVVISRSINFEAQNAMLKTLEEPKEGTYFFLVLESIGSILPTLLSRVEILDLLDKKEVSTKAQKFLEGSMAERLSVVRSLHKNADKSKIKDFIAGLEDLASENSLNFSQKNSILKAKIYSMQRGASQKMLLEWICSVL